jgi:hypothetical protein
MGCSLEVDQWEDGKEEENYYGVKRVEVHYT